MEKMGNYNMEPPGLFRGRGEHPLTGKLKKRCFSESVAINIGRESVVPQCTLPGHAWKSVQHDPTVTWMCAWIENVQSQNKYVQLAASSSFKGKSDLEKYEKAIRLKHCIGKVRKDYTTKLKSKEKEERQMATAMWLIDKLALRVGGEKGDDEADTVGCCSLRKEHLTFLPGDDSFSCELEFLGKDSMLFKQTIKFDNPVYGELGPKIYSCLKQFCSGKAPTDQIFETLVPSTLNKHLNSLMKGLTAKVFRTYNASFTLEDLLPTPESLVGLTVPEMIAKYNDANREVAILCNHQKTVSKAAEAQLESANEKLDTVKKQAEELTQWRSWVKNGKESKVPLKDDDSKIVERLAESVKTGQARLNSATASEDKIAAQKEIEDAKTAVKEDQKRRMKEKHYFKTVPTVDKIDARILKWAEDISKIEIDLRNRDDNKEVALGTSKINYMDPRISVAWCKRCEVPIEKIFAKTLREKFNWAMAVPHNWKFD